MNERSEPKSLTPSEFDVSNLFLPDLDPLFWSPPRIGVTSAWWGHVPFAHWIVASIRPLRLVELGTHRGVSYTAFCEAVMRQGLETRCNAIDTWIGDAHSGTYDDSILAEFRSFHDARYGAFSSLIQSKFDDALEYFEDGSIDLLHIDGMHSYEAVAHDFSTWLPKLSPSAVVLFHDINVRHSGFGAWRLWEEQCRNYPNFSFIHAHGLGVLAVGSFIPTPIQVLCSLVNPQHINAIRERFSLIGERWNLEYRDQLRISEINVIAAERETAAHELAILRPHLADLENARATLHDALQEQYARTDQLQTELTARTPKITASISHHFASNIRSTPESASQTMQNELLLKRACIFSFYDDQGIVDDYVVFFLKALAPFVDRIIFYSNGPLSRNSEIVLKDCVDEVILRPNVGFDLMAYKEGLEKLDFNNDGIYDEIIMANHTCYGPVFPFQELFSEMTRRECDFWGITAHMEMTPNPFSGVGTLPYHINANFIAVRRDLIQSKSFRQYWDALRASRNYEEAIMSHEVLFTEHFAKLGYKADTYIESKKYGSHYPAILDIDETLIDRNPIIKRRAFFHDPRFLEAYAGDLPRALRVLEQTSSYDRSLIWQNIVRSSELRTLNTNAGLTSVLPDVRIKQNAPLPDCGRLAVCVHVYYTEMLEEILDLTDTIPLPFDFIATTETLEKKLIIEHIVTGRGNIANVIVRVVEQNRGRDMSALFISCRDLFLDGPYGLVCRLHTKKSPQVAAGRGNLFKRHMFENLLNSTGYTTNVLDMFADNPWIGVAVPPVVQISYWTLGHAWFINRPKADEIRDLLDIKVPYDIDTPVAAYGTMFWFRPIALRKLFQHPWKWSEFNAEPYHVDGGLAHVLERTICYAAQDARYTTQQILSPHLAGWNYGMLEYKLQKLSAALPNSDFSQQCNMLEHWKEMGYPNTMPSSLSELDAAMPQTPLTVREASSQVLLAIKKSLSYRSPIVFKVLRPVYRAITGRKQNTGSKT